MAESYQTEEEQIEALKNWWKENGKSTVISIVIGIAAIVGWQGWQKQEHQGIEAASAIYQNLLIATAGQNGVVTEQQKTTANHLADTLKSDFPKSIYADFAALYKAKYATENNDLSLAEQELRWVLDGDAAEQVVVQASLRLARVLYAQEKYDEALAQLQVDSAGFSSKFEETKGDIYAAQGNTAAALVAYQKASELGVQSEPPIINPLLRFKSENLKSHSAEPTVTASQGDA